MEYKNYLQSLKDKIRNKSYKHPRNKLINYYLLLEILEIIQNSCYKNIFTGKFVFYGRIYLLKELSLISGFLINIAF
ncbi:hypothetical protein [Mycoplasma sp. CB776]